MAGFHSLFPPCCLQQVNISSQYGNSGWNSLKGSNNLQMEEEEENYTLDKLKSHIYTLTNKHIKTNMPWWSGKSEQTSGSLLWSQKVPTLFLYYLKWCTEVNKYCLTTQQVEVGNSHVNPRLNGTDLGWNLWLTLKCPTPSSAWNLPCNFRILGD